MTHRVTFIGWSGKYGDQQLSDFLDELLVWGFTDGLDCHASDTPLDIEVDGRIVASDILNCSNQDRERRIRDETFEG